MNAVRERPRWEIIRPEPWHPVGQAMGRNPTLPYSQAVLTLAIFLSIALHLTGLAFLSRIA